MPFALLSLGASPPVHHTLASEPAEQPFQAPAWTIGYYATLWSPDNQRSNGGDETTLGVQFTGEWKIMPALEALGIKKGGCDDTQKSWCDGQSTYAESTGKSADEARKGTMEEFTECVPCLMTEADKKTMAKPWSAAANNPQHRGAQYLSLGGGANAPAWEMDALDDFVDGSAEIKALKDAGFAGVCFDIEGSKGGQELVDAFESAFAVLRKNGLDVMITTSHSAPYEADSDEIRRAFVKSWANSDNIGYLSPQLYTSGGEGVPQLEPLQGELGDIEWDLYKGMKAKFVPSIVGKGQVKAVKDFFEPLGIKVDGYVTWGQEHVADDAPPSLVPADDCSLKGICGDAASTTPEVPTAPVVPTVPEAPTAPEVPAAEAAVPATPVQAPAPEAPTAAPVPSVP